MGTRADFYVGSGKGAEWLGSIAWDGYEFAETPDHPITAATSEQEFREAVTALSEREDFTKPEDGWPWPWNTSATTDYAYAFQNGETRWENFDGDWPDMSDRKNVQIGGKRSGIIVVGM